jgi:two-component system cell cycle sensor histidine kinase/response regulator CckA
MADQLKNKSTLPAANRILIIDDNRAIQADFRKILAPQSSSESALEEAKSLLFGQPADVSPTPGVIYQIDSATQGQEGLQMVEQAADEGRPYALAFVDVRMPPGWDGIETVARIWQKYPELPVVICTAYSDYSWPEMMAKLGHSDNLVILRKPFEAVEVMQLAHSFTRKWLLARQVREHIEELDGLVQSRTRNLQEANEALRRSEERFAKAFRNSPVPMVLQNLGKQQYVDVNESFLLLTGFKREDVLGQTPAGLNLFPKPETGREILDALSAQRPVRNLQTELCPPDGKILTVLISAETFELENEPHVLTSIQDISERLNVENQLRQAQKMEVVGQIAAGIAHDFNNILCVIQGHAELQLNVGKLDESLAGSLQEIAQASARAASLTRQLLAFSRKQMLHRRPLDLRESLDNLGKMLQRIIGEHIRLRIQCAENLPPVFADAVSLEQIVINLAVNARDAMPQGGPLTIVAEPAVIDVSYKEREPDAVIGTFIRLSVADEGSGMDAAVRKKIFEPFFTTKQVGKGTGMGLATVYGIVKQHQGWIEVESKPGAGSVFKVFLPVTDGEVQKTSESRTDLIRVADVQSRTIFIVEDETQLREMASTILKRLGHQVVVAQDGPEALSLWPQHRGKIDLLFTDMMMPGGMTGRELADRLRGEEPRLRVIYSTGYSMDLSGPGMELVEGVNCLLKPYDATTLARAVKKAFANGN